MLTAAQRYDQRHRREPLYLYRAHRQNARSRGILFWLTFEQWSAIWQESGKWEQRGLGADQFCMARMGDQGAYEVGNVVICSNRDNRIERNKNYRLLGDSNPAFGKDYWAMSSPEERERRKAQVSVKMSGKKKSEHMRTSLAASATGRRRVVRDGRKTWAYPGDTDYPGTF